MIIPKGGQSKPPYNLTPYLNQHLPYAHHLLQIKWYMVLVAYLLAVLLALPNAYGDGLTDWDMASMYGKLAILLFAAWGGADGGIVSGLVSGEQYAGLSVYGDPRRMSWLLHDTFPR